MAREPELSIKVKVDPVIKPDQLKDTIEKKVKDSKEIPEIEIKPDEDKLVQNVQDALKDLEVPITPKIDATKLGNDLQKEINKIKELPSVKINVDVDNFSNTLNKKLKTELKEVNEKLNYYLKNLTTNTAGLNSVVEGLFPNRGISNEVQHELKRIQTELTTGLKGTAEKIQPFKVTDLFQIDGKEGTATVRRVKQLVTELRNDVSKLDEASFKKGLGDEFNSDFEKFQNKAKETLQLLSVLKNNLNSEKFTKIFNDNTFDAFSNTRSFDPLIKKLKYIVTSTNDATATEDAWGEFIEELQDGSEKGTTYIDSFCDNTIKDLDKVSSRTSDIISEQKTAIEVVKEMTETLNKAIKDDNSGYLSDAEIKTYGAAFDEVLSNIATKQAAINDEREKGVRLENSIVEATRLTRNALSQELKEYEALFKKFDTDKIAKFAETTNLADFIKNQEAKMQAAQGNSEKNQVENGTYNVTDVKFNIDPAVLQLKVDAAFKDVSAPIDLHLKKDASKHVKDELTAALAESDLTSISKNAVDKTTDNNQAVPIKGHVTITDADVTVKMGKPVAIPAEAIVDKSAVIDTSKTTVIGEAIDIPVKATLKTENITTPKEAVPIKVKAELTETDIKNAAEKPKRRKKSTAQSEQQSSVGLTGKVALEQKDIIPPETPVELKGHIGLTLEDISVPDKIPLNGELKIANATKEIKEATKKAQPKQSASKSKNGLTDRDFERKSKELLTSLASIMKGKARVQNSLTNHNRKGQTKAETEDAGYLANLSRRERTTKSKLTKLYKGHGGRSAWQNNSIYHSAVEDSEHIRNSRVAENSDKDKATEEEKYIAALRQRPKLYKEIAEAKRKYGNDSEYVKSAQKELQNTLNVIDTFESKVGKQYLQSMPERRNALEENMSNLRKNREDKQIVNAKAQTKADGVASKARLDSEKEFLENLAKEPKLWANVEDARKKYGDNSAEAKQAEYLKNKNKSTLDAFKAVYNGSLSDIPGYDDQIKENNLAMATYQSGMTRKENEAQQKQHDANQKAFQKRRENAAKQASNAQKAVEKSSADMIDRVAKTIEENKKAYLAAEKEIENRQKELLNVNDPSTRQDILDKISEAKNKKKTAGHTINSFQDSYTGLVQNAWNDINSEKKSRQIAQNEEYEARASKEAASTKKENLSILQQYNQELDKEFKLYKDLKKADPNNNPEDYTSKKNLFNDQHEKVNDIRKQIHDKGLNTSRDYQTATNRYYEKQAGFDKGIANASDAARIKANNEADAEVVSSLINLYKQLDSARNDRTKLFKDEDVDKLHETDEIIQKITDDIENLEVAAQNSGIDLVNNDSYMEAFEKSDKLRVDTTRDFASKRANYVDQQTSALMDEYRAQITRMQNAGTRREQALGTNRPWKANQFDSQYNEAKEVLKALDDELQDRGLSLEKEYLDLLDSKAQAENVVTEAVKARTKAEAASVEVTNNELNTLQGYRTQISNVLGTLRKNNAEGSDTYAGASVVGNAIGDFYNRLYSNIGASGSDKNKIAVEWANANGIKNVKDYQSAIKGVNILISKYRELTGNIASDNTLNKSITKARTEFANLQSEFSDYIRKYPKVAQVLTNEVKKLQDGLNDPNGWQNKAGLSQLMAELKVKAKNLRLESSSLLDIFEKLFGQHLSTMITMAALHKMQESLQKIYQNVVEIDSAMTELRKVTNLTASGYEEFMDRAADQAQKLGISISDFINSTADWARLGYDEQDAEELARVSSLLKNVGDGIESASDASSYLISGMQGFGLAADQASEFLDVLNQIANTEPVTANDLGIIMQKSAAAMNAAGNTYQETMAMAAAVNGVLQDNDVSGTYLKTLSMYLRAAKTDAEDAGIEIDGMANSVSELRSELKQLTGVDIMSDAAGKNFKSTYQIMKELSKVWGSLSDVTQANVTELISGKRGGQATSALLNNFSVAEDAMKQAANATGSALAENAKYLDSIQGRLAQLDTSFQSLSTHVLDSGIVKYAVSFLTTIIKITDNITKLSGALPPIAAAVSGVLSVMQMNGKLENGAGKVNMPAYARCA